MVIVNKPDDSISICGDYRQLNLITAQWHALIPVLAEILERIGRSRILSKLNLNKGFHQVPLHSETREKTTITTPFGRYCYNKMPFGIKNAPAIFQDLMQRVLADCIEFAAVYIDDSVVFSPGITEHVAHIGKVLSALSGAGLTVKPSKCQWGRKTLEYLGHVVGDGQYTFPDTRVTMLQEYARPTTKKQLRSFLGMIGYYRSFIANFANHSAKLIST